MSLHPGPLPAMLSQPPPDAGKALARAEQPHPPPTSAASSSSTPTLATASSAPTRPRQRKWHPRVFTGCGNCRKRHIKCDERSPACANCTRKSLACDYVNGAGAGTADQAGGGGRFMFRTVVTVNRGRSSSSGSSQRNATARTAQAPSPTSLSEITFDSSSSSSTPFLSGGPDAASSSSFPSSSSPSTFPFSGSPEMARLALCRIASPLVARDTLYCQHFLRTVSSMLIVYDTQSNANPYRMLPQIAGSSGMLWDTMVALGAMHMAHMPADRLADRAAHRRAGTEAYGRVVAGLRAQLAPAPPDASRTGRTTTGGRRRRSQPQDQLETLATSLLLCAYEMMCSGDSTWKVHLGGACHLFETLFRPRLDGGGGYGGDHDSSPSSSSSSASSHEQLVIPMRRFLVSLLAYLDVAAACATGGGTLVPGDYWETMGGGWEYNLGTPSFRPWRVGRPTDGGGDAPSSASSTSSTSPTSASPSTDRVLAQIRHSWSRLMSIQSGISSFATDRGRHAAAAATARWSPPALQIRLDSLANRLAEWQDSAPDVYARLAALDRMPPDASVREQEVLTWSACVQCYALGCTIYLERAATRTLGRARVRADVAAAVDGILRLACAFSDGLYRMGFLWSLFTAGTAAVDEAHRTTLKETIAAMNCFGFRNVTRSLEILEYVWLQERLFGEADYDAFERLLTTVLIP